MAEKENLPEVIQNSDIQIVQQSPMEMAQSFLSNNGNPDSLEKMMELQERFESNEAKKAYYKAMAAFKANPPKILKDKKVAFKNTKYSHATLAKIVEEISKSLSVHGLSATWKIDQKELIGVTCLITHILGYSESTTLKAGPDASGGKNAIQAIGSTVSYLERYTILALTGLATHDMDDDGIKSEQPKCLSEKQCIEIRDTIESIGGLTEKEFLKMAGCDEIEDIHAANFGTAKVALKERSKVAK